MRRVTQVLQVTSAKSGRWTEQEVLDLKFRNRMMEESFVTEVVLECGKTESSGCDLANLQGAFEVRNQILPGNGPTAQRNVTAHREVVGVKGATPASPVIGSTSEVTQTSGCKVIGPPQVAAPVRVSRPNRRAFHPPRFKEPYTKTRAGQCTSQRDSGRPCAVNCDVVCQRGPTSISAGNCQCPSP